MPGRLDEEDARDWRRHRKLFKGWELSEPEPATEVPQRYELAFGGTIQTGVDDDGNPRWECEPRNPVGRGLIATRRSAPSSRPIRRAASSTLAANGAAASPDARAVTLVQPLSVSGGVGVTS